MRFKVIVRVRPLSAREKLCGSQHVVTVESQNNIAVTNIKVPEQNAGDSRERVRRFAFDYCFSEDATQDQIFETVDKIVCTSLKNRSHSCVLAYGQTSSGKTHTMMGFPHDPGLTPRLCRRIFTCFESGTLQEQSEKVKVSVSYLEIYNEKVADLLSDKCNGSEKPLRVREHPKRGPYVEGLSQHVVSTDVELLKRLESGTNKRRVGSTATNPRSSRSHSVFSICCNGVKLHLVDLAGNERAGSKGYGPGRFREGANINKSLVALGNVISTLADHSKTSSVTRNKFVPYRDSVLTWLLRDTLQGSSNTVMIATISPSSAFYSETVNTLRFGQRAKLIVYKPVIVEDSKERTIRELRAEIARLKDLLGRSNSIEKEYLCENSEEDTERNTSMSSVTNYSQLQSPTRDISMSNQEDISQNTDKLLPIMNVCESEVSTHISQNPIKNRLKKTYSLDRTYSLETDMSKSCSSQDSLHSPKHSTKTTTSSSGSSRRLSSISLPKQTALSLKRQAITKGSSVLKTITQKKPLQPSMKSEKGVVTEVSGLKKNVQEISRKNSYVKPRAQIVAAVTSRLYNKVKKKDMGTSTENLAVSLREPPKELSICSNARNRLRELTQKALKAHRNKHEETQTDLFPVVRVKEVATDCSDLKLQLMETNEVAVLHKPESKDAQVECSLLNHFIEGSLRNILVLTRSCGIQTNAEEKMSFTKYLTESNQQPTNNPIISEAWNINISHNYVSRTGSLSDDSLENQRNMTLPTPDLISNHNSLEQDKAPTDETSKLQFAQCNHLLDYFNKSCDVLKGDTIHKQKAEIRTVPWYQEDFKNVRVLCTHALKSIPVDFCQEKTSYLPPFCPKVFKCRPVYSTSLYSNNTITSAQPMVYHCSDIRDMLSDSDESYPLGTPDSMEYHMSNQKKVQFNEKPKTEKNDRRMFKAMKEFLVEAKLLMTNLSKFSCNVNSTNDCQQPHLDEFDIQVTLNEVSGLEKPQRRKRKCKSFVETSSTQTNGPSNVSCCSQTEFPEYILPINKYEALLEDSCKRLEEQIRKSARTRHISLASNDIEDEVLYERPRYNPWDLTHLDLEDSSLESNPVTFSDYGSLPRKTHKKHRTPTCSPSAFLRQLTQMRRQIIENSKEELFEDYGNPNKL
ncbi:hypothetical protein ABEB36_002116 [Hypothenemus hampei]|uniref:Kinesin motor domain-containing protein n=1 Tax=Hypothenemus hampei TaxID=57062 RepID=A0ABD1F4L8_HYPHA